MQINLYDEQNTNEISSSQFERAAITVMEKELGEYYKQLSLDKMLELSITITDKDDIREINRTFRDNDSVTDVLSFPQYQGKDELIDEARFICEEGEANREILLGDVVICIDKAVEQSHEYGTSIEREITYLFVHSMLHLLGYDHMNEEDKKVMRTEEKVIMNKLGIRK